MLKNIKNDFLTIGISSVGAELQSVKTVKDNLEYLWNGDHKYWGRRAPVLFPIVGSLPENTYTHEGKSYKMPNHGFLRDCDFDIVSENENSVEFKAADNDEIFKKYPFHFEVKIGYRLMENCLEIMHEVVNKGNNNMWFSIGEHPGFRCPLFENETMDDYVLEFDRNETVERRFIEDELLIDKTEKFLDNSSTVTLSHELFERRAIILKGFKSDFVTLKSRKHDRKATVTLEGYPYLGIWSPIGDAPFVCIEPWHGVTSIQGNNVELKEKEGIMKLSPNEIFKCGYKIIVN